jgi:CRP-like cAMP-binding protein
MAESRNPMVDLLSRLPLFQALPEEISSELAKLACERTFADGALVFREGDPGDAWYIVVEGAVRIVRQLDDGGTLALTSLGPGASFGEISVFDDGPRSASAVAEGATRLVAFGRDGLHGLLAERPADLARLLVAIIAGLSANMRRTTESLVTVYETGKIAGTVRDPVLLAHEVLTRLHGAVGATRSAIGIWNPFSEGYDWVRIDDEADSGQEVLEPSDALVVRAFESGEAILAERDATTAALRPWLGVATIVVPLYQENEGLGVLVFASDRDDAFGDDQKRLANAVALQVSGSLVLARHEQDERDRVRLEQSRARSLRM